LCSGYLNIVIFTISINYSLLNVYFQTQYKTKRNQLNSFLTLSIFSLFLRFLTFNFIYCFFSFNFIDYLILLKNEVTISQAIKIKFE